MKRIGGFTLIELMVVVGIMVLVASIVVTGSFGMSRASGYLAAENIVYNTMQAARQKACTDGKRVLVAFIPTRSEQNKSKDDDEIDDYALVSVEAIGTVASVENLYIRDRSSMLATYAGTRSEDSIWNLKTGTYVEGPFTNVMADTTGPIPLDGNGAKFGYRVTELRLIRNEPGTSGRGGFNQTMWHEGDAYGFQIGETQELPTGFKLGVGSVGGSPQGELVVFEPDGSSFHCKASASGLSGPSKVEIFIYEEISRANAIKVTVDKGTVKVDKR